MAFTSPQSVVTPSSSSHHVTSELVAESPVAFTSWLSFFVGAGIERKYAKKYANLFNEHHVNHYQMDSISVELLSLMGIKLVGHMMAIIKKARECSNLQNSHPTSRGNSKKKRFSTGRRIMRKLSLTRSKKDQEDTEDDGAAKLTSVNIPHDTDTATKEMEVTPDQAIKCVALNNEGKSEPRKSNDRNDRLSQSPPKSPNEWNDGERDMRQRCHTVSSFNLSDSNEQRASRISRRSSDIVFNKFLSDGGLNNEIFERRSSVTELSLEEESSASGTNAKESSPSNVLKPVPRAADAINNLMLDGVRLLTPPTPRRVIHSNKQRGNTPSGSPRSTRRSKHGGHASSVDDSGRKRRLNNLSATGHSYVYDADDQATSNEWTGSRCSSRSSSIHGGLDLLISGNGSSVSRPGDVDIIPEESVFVTPFTQVASVLQAVRDSLLENEVLYEKMDWALGQLDQLADSGSIAKFTHAKFDRLLSRRLTNIELYGMELSDYLENSFGQRSLTKRHSSPHTLSMVHPDIAKRLDGEGDVNQYNARMRARTMSMGAEVPRFGVTTPNEASLSDLLLGIDRWDFDPFELDRLSCGHPLACIVYHIFNVRGYRRLLNVSRHTLINFLNVVEASYHDDNAFHNATHAADVTQTTFHLLCAGSFKGMFSELEILSAILGAAIHDADHPGLTNQFLIQTSSPLAIMYNDDSVLENHHLAHTFRLMQSPECRILDGLDNASRRSVRDTMIQIVRGTDMANHFSMFASFKSLTEEKARRSEAGHLSFSETNKDSDHVLVLQTLVHCADISNPAKPIHLSVMWQGMLCEEFFRQGDRERELGMNISPMMDREKTDAAKSQLGFIDFIVLPLYEAWACLVTDGAEDSIKHCRANREYWAIKVGGEDGVFGKEEEENMEYEDSGEEGEF